MGWTSIYSNLSNKEFVEQYLTDSRVIETSIYGREVYQLAHTHNNKDDLYIRVTLINRKDGEVFYKDMDESCGPCYYNCPAKFLKRSTQTDQNSISWRDACRKHSAQKKVKAALVKKVKALAPGSRVRVLSGAEWIFQFTHTKTRFAGKLANVEPGKQNSTFAVRYADVVEIL